MQATKNQKKFAYSIMLFYYLILLLVFLRINYYFGPLKITFALNPSSEKANDWQR